MGVCLLVVGSLSAQKKIILTDGDAGKTIPSIHNFSFENPTYTFQLTHRMRHGLPLRVELVRSEKFNEGPYSLEQQLPLTIAPTATQDLTFSVNYGRSIRDRSSVTLVIYPEGDKDRMKRGIQLQIELSATGKVMFWDDRQKVYTSQLPTNAPFIQLAWNGTGTGSAQFYTRNDARGAFFLTLNKANAQPIPANTVIPLKNKASKVYTVTYSPPSGRRNSSDYATLVFQDAEHPTESIAMTVNASGRVASSVFSSYTGSNVSSNVTYDPNAGSGVANNAGNGVGNGSSNNGTGNTNAGTGSGYPNNNTGTGPYAGTGSGNGSGTGTATGNGSGSSNNGSGAVGPGLDPNSGGDGIEDGTGGEPRPIYDPVTAMDRLEDIFENRKNKNFIKVNKTDFVKDPESSYPDKYVTRIPLDLDTLGNDPNFGFKEHHAAVVTDEDSIPLQIITFNKDSMRMVLGVHPEDEDRVTSLDSFTLSIGLTPYYLAGDNEVYLEDQSKIMQAETISQVKTESRLWLWILIAILVFLGLFFLIGRLWIRRPIYSFRYLREAKYQRERFKKQQEEDFTLPTETIYVDLNRHEEDLIQLNFLTRSEEDPDAIIKAKELSATVPSPYRKGLRQFFTWFYGLFGVDKEPRFNAVYYSFRIEPQKGGIPQHLRLKDSEGLLLLGTSLTNNVLATDHQDFRFRKRPFSYSIFLDPTEILDYSGSMRTVSLLFRIIEEPFEGYISTRDFKVDLEINRRL